MGIDAAIIIAAETTAAIAAVMTIDESIDMARISKRYAEIYEQKDLHYHNQFRLGRENVFINEIWALPVPQFDFIGQVNRIPFNPFTGAMPGGVGINVIFDATTKSELTMLQGRIYADIGNYLFAFEKERVRIEEERRWEYRTNVINLGLNLANNVSDRFNTSLSILDVAIGNAADTYAGFSNELGQFAGFKRRLAQEPQPISYRFDAPTLTRSPQEIPDISTDIASTSLVVRRVP